MTANNRFTIVVCLIAFSIICDVGGVTITYNAAVNKQSFQSSVYSDGQRSYPASLANDGLRDPRTPHCAVTDRETNPWWAVDLGEPTTVSRVDLTNTAESGESANNFVVGLTNELDQEDENTTLTVTLWNYTVCGQYPGVVPAGATVSVHCPFNLPPLRYVIVQFPVDNDRMRLCEVEVFATIEDEISRDVALNKTSFQSSGVNATLINDGNTSTCSLTNREINPWWAVDLGVETPVHQINFTNSPTLSANFIVGLTNTDPRISRPVLRNYWLCGLYPGNVPGSATVSLHCASDLPPSRYVIVQLPGLQRQRMHFCELQVFTFVSNPILKKVALRKPAAQISTHVDMYGRHAAKLANDGRRQTDYEVHNDGCAGSNRETDPWWAVDLDVPTVVCLVKLTNRRDADSYRSNNFIVGLTNDYPRPHAPVPKWNYTLCGQYPGPVGAGATVAVQCSNVCELRLRFRYVVVQFPLVDDQMNVCEIEVFAIDEYRDKVETTDSNATDSNTTDNNMTVNRPEPTIHDVSSNLISASHRPTGPTECNGCAHYYSATVALAVFSCIIFVVIVILLVLLLREPASKLLTPLHERMTKKSTPDPTPVPMPLVADAPAGRLELTSDPSSTENYRASDIYTDTADEDMKSSNESNDEDYQNKDECHELEAASTC